MSDQADIERVWDIIETVGVGMLTTRYAGGLRARPLEARPERKAGVIWFLTDVRSHKDDEIAWAPDIGLIFIDHKAKAYLSLTGQAEILHEHTKVAEIWKDTDAAWWDGPDDPNLRVIKITPRTAELWDGPASKAVAAYEFAKAMTTGEAPDLGENRKATVQM
jgi:general stress protein 26